MIAVSILMLMWPPVCGPLYQHQTVGSVLVAVSCYPKPKGECVVLIGHIHLANREAQHCRYSNANG